MSPDAPASSAPPAPTDPLPDQPNLELLKKHAKRLLRAARGGEAEALARCRAASPRLAAFDDETLASKLRLADAQHAVAREHGFPSWPRLVRHVEDRQPLAVRAEWFLEAIRHQQARAATRLLARYPELGRANFFAACAAGEADFLATLIATFPALVSAPHARDGFTPLLYACASPLHETSASRARGIFRAAELLLAHGASANEFMLHDPPDPHSKIPALYFASVAGHTALVKLLLEHGAEANDGESVYHAAELDRRDCLELLAAHGAELSAAHAHWGNTPLYFLAGWKEWHARCASATAGMRWLLEHGADPNVPSLESRETPLHRVAENGRSTGVVELLLDHGAAIDQERADGRTAYALALRTGNVPVAKLLVERGADPSKVTPVDELLEACMTADEDRARALLAAHPDLLTQLGDEDREALPRAAEEKREASVRLMFALGFDLGWQGPSGGGTPLHRAAWHGDPSMTRLLLSLGAPVNVREPEFGCSPLAWAAHGSANCRRADDDYCAVVEALLDAGADRETSINRWGEPPESLGTRRVALLLRRRGFAPAVAVEPSAEVPGEDG